MTSEGKIDVEEAIAMLPDNDQVHVVKDMGGIHLGANWDKKDVIEAFEKHGALLTGPAATSINHGLAFIDDDGTWFVETKEGESQ